MDLARWWNTKAQLGLLGRWRCVAVFLVLTTSPKPSVFAVTAQRCSEVFDPPASVTLWQLPEALQDEFEFQWEFWLDDAPSWEPFFLDIEVLDAGACWMLCENFRC
jgi:hypothetical protein